MNFVALVTHGLSAMSVFGDRIGVRLLLVASAIAASGFVAGAAYFAWLVGTGGVLGNWTPFAAVALVLLLFLTFASSLGFVFIILAGRGSGGFLPFREYPHYLSHTTPWPIQRLNVEQPIHRH